MNYAHKSNTVMRVMGVVNAVSGIVYCEDAGKASAKRLGRFFGSVLSLYRDAKKIYLIWDNWPVHYHEEVMKVLNSYPRVEIVGLPTYSPWLNPMEKVWKMTRHELSHAHPWSDDFREFKKQVRGKFLELSNRPEEVLKYVGLSK